MTIDKNDKSHVGRWSYGNPVELGFRWPDGDGIPAKPVKDPLQPILEVDGRKATFKYTGRWALLWVLKMHGALKGDYAPLKDPNPFMLKFVIPTGSENKAIVYDLITLMAPSSNPKAPGKVLPVPIFPVVAPELDPSAMQYGEQAVLTEGVLTPLEYSNPSEPPLPATNQAAETFSSADTLPEVAETPPKIDSTPTETPPAAPPAGDQEKPTEAPPSNPDQEESASGDAPAAEADAQQTSDPALAGDQKKPAEEGKDS